MKTWPNKVQIFSENLDKQSQNSHLEVNIFARQKSKARSRVRIVQNIFTLPKLNYKGTCTNGDGNFAAEMNCARHFMEHGRASIEIWFMMTQWE